MRPFGELRKVGSMTTQTIAISSPQVNPKFATRQLIKILAVVCECGRTTHGAGIRKWKKCPACGAPIISTRWQRYRDSRPFLAVDRQIFDRYQSEGMEPRPEKGCTA